MKMMLLVTCLLLAVGCKSTYYSTMEKFGYEKRDLLASRVEDAKTDQIKARDQFKTTLQRFQELTGFQGGDLEAKYKQLSSQYDTCKSRADAVSNRITSVNSVAQDLFAEWKEELQQYSNPTLRQQSERELQQSRQRYDQFLVAMRKSEAKMQPVLTAFHDQVLFLKHNLNAQAIASLQGETTKIDTDVQSLVRDMDQAIAEADQFINSMRQGGQGAPNPK